MKIEYFFRVETESDKFSKLNSILSYTPEKGNVFWEERFKRIKHENNLELFVEGFIDKILKNEKLLNTIDIDIQRDISFWCLYEYDNQCNLEFNSVVLNLLGKAKIDLCISCWQGG